ncbi:MAG: DUF2306 domain-containing protein [Pseudomonadota bacterium]
MKPFFASAQADRSDPSLPSPHPILSKSVRSWFAVAMLGQLAFVGFIALFYGLRTARGEFQAWDDKPLIEGYTAGDLLGNLVFITHVLTAAVITLGGLHQLLPALRNRWPISHRIVGRVFVATAYFMAFSGLWLSWIRGTMLSTVSAFATTGNALLILWFVTAAWFFAMRGSIAVHRQWALRAFVVVNGVWFFRIGIMAWILINQGPVGMDKTLSGPADIAISFGSYLLPLALLELYFLGQRSLRRHTRGLASAGLLAGTAITAIGVFGAVAFMWAPHL